MNFIKRGLLSLWAKKGRTLLLCAVFSAILIFVLAGLTIKSAAEKATENAQNSLGATVTLAASREAMFGGGQNDTSTSDSSSTDSTSEHREFTSTPVKVSDAEKIAALDNVKSYVLVTSGTATAGDGIEPITSSDTTSSSSTSDSSQQGPGGMGGGMGGKMQTGDFTITGVSSSADYSSFSDGTATLGDGEALTADDAGTNNVLIEETLAESNGLSVGDTFKLTDSDGENEVTVTVKGIYSTTESASGIAAQVNMLNPVNTIYSYYTLANTLSGNTDEDTVDSAIYTLSEPSKVTAFTKAAEKVIDTDTYDLTTDDQLYQSMITPLENVSSFAKNIVILVAVAGIIILTLIVMLMIRERRYEIGVLLSMGESRAKMIFQFFTEIFVTMLIALVIATFTGNIVGNVVGNQLLSQETTTSQTDTQTQQGANNQQGNQNGGPGGGGGGQMGGFNTAVQGSTEIDDLNITVQPKEVAILAGLGLVISFFSILLSSFGILRLNPKKILIG
ncbi:FtsX-like permease family protein [Enterococcus italicus]|uniref:ABC transporter permease n=1 Tax=Enterococcus italicus TaxID=246144 RepID=UPI0020746D78|nr:FtsX-like permease family protein [Enterococcus italicus]MCM6881197.1 FtsX-like permease family protein [Enterococcus italicus]